MDIKHPQSGYTAAVRQRGQELRKPPIDVPEDAAFLQLGGAEAKKSEAEAEAPPQKKEESSKSVQIELGGTILEGGALLEQKARQLGLLTLVRHEMV